MAIVDDAEMRTTQSELVSSSDDGKIVADTPDDGINESSLVLRTTTGVRISALPVKDEVTTGDGFACVNKGIVESDSFSAENLEIRVVKEEPDLCVENREEETFIDSIESFVVETVLSASGDDCNVEVAIVESELHDENLVVVKEEEMSVVPETGSEYECVNVKVKEEPDLGTGLGEESLEVKYDSVYSSVLRKKDEVIRVQEGELSEINGLLQENKKLEQENNMFLSGDLDGASAKRRKMEMEPYVPIGVKSFILAPTPLRVVKPENLDNPEVIDLESDNLNRIVKQEKSYTHVKMEPVEEMKVEAVKLSSQVKEMKFSRDQKPVYVKKEPVEARKVKVDDGDFPVEKDWYLVGRSLVTATSTSKGRKLEDNEIVNFTFSSVLKCKVPNIVRFSTKRCGEVSRFYLLLHVLFFF